MDNVIICARDDNLVDRLTRLLIDRWWLTPRPLDDPPLCVKQAMRLHTKDQAKEGEQEAQTPFTVRSCCFFVEFFWLLLGLGAAVRVYVYVCTPFTVRTSAAPRAAVPCHDPTRPRAASTRSWGRLYVCVHM